jgi:hypothetical protein
MGTGRWTLCAAGRTTGESSAPQSLAAETLTSRQACDSSKLQLRRRLPTWSSAPLLSTNSASGLEHLSTTAPHSCPPCCCYHGNTHGGRTPFVCFAPTIVWQCEPAIPSFGIAITRRYLQRAAPHTFGIYVLVPTESLGGRPTARKATQGPPNHPPGALHGTCSLPPLLLGFRVGPSLSRPNASTTQENPCYGCSSPCLPGVAPALRSKASRPSS